MCTYDGRNKRVSVKPSNASKVVRQMSPTFTPTELCEMKNKFNRLDCTNAVEDTISWLISPFFFCFLVMISPIVFIARLITDKVLFFIVGKNVIYNVNWEDPRVERAHLNLNSSDHVITIASSGCNVLDYIIDGAKVTACDLNECQVALVEIKVACAQALTYDQFFAIFASNDCDLLRKVYPAKIRPNLTSPTAKFWDEKLPAMTSFMYFGASGQLAFFAFRVLFPIIGLGWIRKAAMEHMPPNVFQGIVDSNCKILIKITAFLIKKLFEPLFIAFAGVPLRQIELGNKRSNTWLTVFENILYRTDFCGDNYFYNGYIKGYFEHECCPNYLKEENFKVMVKNLSNLTLYTGTIEGCLEENLANKANKRPYVTFTVASLLDHMDWMPHEWINSEITCLLKNMDPEKGRIFWRSFSDTVHSPILEHLGPDQIDQYPLTSSNIHGQYDYMRADRVGMYFSSWLVHLKDCDMKIDPRSVSWSSDATTFDTSFLTTLKTGFQIVAFPVKQFFGLVAAKKGADGVHGKNIEAFYQDQAGGYDSFRENFLHARGPMLTCLPIKQGSENVWIDVGGGTARNLEFIPVETIKKSFKKIYIVDISPSLLEIAKARVKKVGLDKIVECVCGDFTDEASLKKVLKVKEGSVDVVTFSYSLSMIPNKDAALENACKLLKDGGAGRLGVADFFDRSGKEFLLQYPFQLLRWFESMFHVQWFKMDGVYLLNERMFAGIVGEGGGMKQTFIEKFRGSVPLFPVLRPYQGFVYFKKE